MVGSSSGDAARGDGPARDYGKCDICGEKNDNAVEALVTIECNQRGCAVSPATYHQGCVFDVIRKNPIGVREKRR